MVEVQYSDRVGSEIFVFKRTPSAHFPDVCDLSHDKAWAKYVDGDYGSVSIDHDTLFLDSGTDNWRGLEIISLKDKKRIVSTSYNGSVGRFSLAT